MKQLIAVLAIAASGISGAAHAGGPGPVLADPTVTNVAPGGALAGLGGLGAGAVAGIIAAVVVVGVVVSDDDATATTTTPVSN